MNCFVTELMEKTVINAATGERIGQMCDVEIDTQNACLSALVVAVKKSGSFITRCERVKIDWCHIKIIGKDAVLVDCIGEFKAVHSEKNLLEKLWN